MSRHVHRQASRTPEETKRLRALREQYQRERPTPDQLLAEGGHKDFIRLGDLITLHEVVAAVRSERERQKLTLAELARRTGIDEAALSRLETGKNANPTLDTISRVANALGKVVVCSLQDGQGSR